MSILAWAHDRASSLIKSVFLGHSRTESLGGDLSSDGLCNSLKHRICTLCCWVLLSSPQASEYCRCFSFQLFNRPVCTPEMTEQETTCQAVLCAQRSGGEFNAPRRFQSRILQKRENCIVTKKLNVSVGFVFQSSTVPPLLCPVKMIYCD